MRYLTIIVIAFISIFLFFSFRVQPLESSTLWEFQAIDTMKFSRDVARAKIDDPSFDITIGRQIKQIADTGATHVGIATPYDEEFLPFLRRWVDAARKNNLKVWFRGNWSGWEKWFEYEGITREEHIRKTDEFIRKNVELFEDGDVFSACPECENGGPGDPRLNGDPQGHKKFLIDEYQVTKKAFSDINRDVASNYHSMNGDVARLIMDQETTRALDGIVVVDHYVSTPTKLAEDIKDYANRSGGKVVLGEYGAPIPDIHGDLTELEQAAWISEALTLLAGTPELHGLSYWTNVGGSTELWDSKGVARPGVSTLRSFYKPFFKEITLYNNIRQTIRAAKVTTLNRTFVPDNKGRIMVPDIKADQIVTIEAPGYHTVQLFVSELTEAKVVLNKIDNSPKFRLFEIFSNK